MVKKKRRRGSNKRGMICISSVVLVLLVVMFVQSSTIKEKNLLYAMQEESLKDQIESENLRTKDIEELKSYMETKEYAEQIARDKLGLVYEDEILFREE